MNETNETKRLKVLDIIITKQVSLYRFKTCVDAEHYNSILPETMKLDRTEFDLIEEVLAEYEKEN